MDTESSPLRRIAARVRAAALADFEGTDLPRLRRLHDALSTRGVPLAALSVCGHGTAEVRYTRLLRYFLDPRSPHGLGSRVLRAFLLPEFERARVPADGLGLEKARVEAEVELGHVVHGGRRQGCVLDLLVTLTGHHVLIEHKIASPEAGSPARDEYAQLARYSKAVRENRRDIQMDRSLCLFLTPDRTPPRTDQGWWPVSHGDLVARCVEAVGTEPGLPLLARHNLGCFLWDLLTGPAWQEEGVLTELARWIVDVLGDHARAPAMARWCANAGLDWKVALSILEACDVQADGRGGGDLSAGVRGP